MSCKAEYRCADCGYCIECFPHGECDICGYCDHTCICEDEENLSTMGFDDDDEIEVFIYEK